MKRSELLLGYLSLSAWATRNDCKLLEAWAEARIREAGLAMELAVGKLLEALSVGSLSTEQRLALWRKLRGGLSHHPEAIPNWPPLALHYAQQILNPKTTNEPK